MQLLIHASLTDYSVTDLIKSTSVYVNYHVNKRALNVCSEKDSTGLEIRWCMNEYMPHQTIDAIIYSCHNLSYIILLKRATGHVIQKIKC